ncbi:MAG: hypothetical protein AAF541_01990 [Pseudomonadota bacterium]
MKVKLEMKDSKFSKMKPIAAAVGTALVASLGASSVAAEDENLFVAQDLDRGYDLLAQGEGKCGEGKCGEGSCGEDKDGEGKCGEGKCGEGSCGEDKDGEGKCGEGKCGGEKDGEGKCGEGKCGEGKCGGAA